MSEVYYVTTNGERSGRSSLIYRTEGSAQGIVDNQNKRAEELGIKARYQLASCDEGDVSGDIMKQIRD